MTKLRKGDKITVLLPNKIEHAYVIGQSRGGARVAWRQDAGTTFEPIRAADEGATWTRGWSDEARDALLASRAMMAAPRGPESPDWPFLVGTVATKLVGTIVRNPVVAAGLGMLAAHLVTNRAKAKR